MTDEFIRARLGYLEQALASLSLGKRANNLARQLAEQYVASYGDDFNPISTLTFSEIIDKTVT